MLKKIVYIASDDRSGSTLLDLCISNHPKIVTVGELYHLNAYITNNRLYYDPIHPLTCLCGEPVLSCNFWVNIFSNLNGDIDKFSLRKSATIDIKSKLNYKWFFNLSKFNLLKNLFISRIIKKNPLILDSSLIRHLTGYTKIAKNNFEFYNAVSKTTNAEYIIDSSKSIARFKYLYMENKERMFLLHLVRDPAAVVFSKVKRGQDINFAIERWKSNENDIIKCYENVFRENKVRIKYEDFCLDTKTVVRQICDKLHINYSEKMEGPTNHKKHHIGGSPSKFKYNGTIVYDLTYKKALSINERAYIYNKTLPFSRMYGYFS